MAPGVAMLAAQRGARPRRRLVGRALLHPSTPPRWAGATGPGTSASTPALANQSGNIGPTAWWDGRIVGGWAHRKDGEIAVRLLEDAGTAASAAIAAEAQRLRDWIGADPNGTPRRRITPRFRTPLERELAGELHHDLGSAHMKSVVRGSLPAWLPSSSCC